jgi:hypothetical protein
MMHDMLAAAAFLSDVDLIARLRLLAARARENTAEMVAHLAELEKRRTYLAEGYGSLFDYCYLALRLSEHAAYNRMVAARAVRRFPSILTGLADGSLNLTTVRLVASHLTAENHREVLGRAAGRSKRETEALVASLAPRPDIASSIRRMPAAAPSGAAEAPAMPAAAASTSGITPDRTAPTTTLECNNEPGDGVAVDVTLSLAPPPSARPVIAPLSPTRYRIQFTVGVETHDDLRLVQDLLRREIPDGDPGAIFARALKLLLAQAAKEKTAAISKPGPARPTAPGSRHIPASVKRAVWLRDRGQCAFVGRTGRRCTQRAFLELHHIQPFALGGEATVSNISLRCRRHNTHEAELVFGIEDGPRATGSNSLGQS